MSYQGLCLKLISYIKSHLYTLQNFSAGRTVETIELNDRVVAKSFHELVKRSTKLPGLKTIIIFWLIYNEKILFKKKKRFNEMRTLGFVNEFTWVESYFSYHNIWIVADSNIRQLVNLLWFSFSQTCCYIQSSWTSLFLQIDYHRCILLSFDCLYLN